MATQTKKPILKRRGSAPGRHGRAKTPKTTKITVVLPVEVAQRVRQVVESGAAESQTALARTAIEKELRRLREEEIAQAYREAANDPLFMQDLEECMRDFAELDADSLRYIDVEPDYGDEATP